MTTENSKISVKEAISRIKKLLKNKNGDSGRLRHILNRLENDESLLKSDYQYLQKKIEAIVIIPNSHTQSKNNEEIKNVKKLISHNQGDPDRLQDILNRLQKNLTLYQSDKNYLKSQTKELSKFSPSKKTTRNKKSILTKSKKSDRLFGEPVPKKTVRESDRSIHSKDYEIMGNQNEDKLLNQDIENSKEEINQIKKERQQIRAQREELSKLIENKQKYPVHTKPEINALQKNTWSTKTISKEKSLMMDELGTNQGKIHQINNERDELIGKILQYKENSENEINQKKIELNQLQKEYSVLLKESHDEQLTREEQLEREKVIKNNKQNLSKSIKSTIEVSIVGIGMTIGFSVLIMKLTDVWPCEIASMLNFSGLPFC